jgi:hypothetical protein
MVLGSNPTPASSILKYLFRINEIFCDISLCGYTCDNLYLIKKPTKNGYEMHRNGSEAVSRSIETNLSSIIDWIHESNVLIYSNMPARVSGVNRTWIHIEYISRLPRCCIKLRGAWPLSGVVKLNTTHLKYRWGTSKICPTNILLLRMDSSENDS